MKVHWTDAAIDCLDDIFNHIAKDSPSHALRMIDRLTDRSKQIEKFPMSGHRVPKLENEDIREIFEGSYRIVYHIVGDQIDVIAVIHTAREFSQHDLL